MEPANISLVSCELVYKSVCKLSNLARSDVRPEAKIELKFTKRFRLGSDSEVLVEYNVTECANRNSITKSCPAFAPRLATWGVSSKKGATSRQDQPIAATIKLLDVKEVSWDVIPHK